MSIPKFVILITKGNKKETWGSLTKIVKEHPEIHYNSIKNNKFPFLYAGWKFEKIKHNGKHKM